MFFIKKIKITRRMRATKSNTSCHDNKVQAMVAMANINHFFVFVFCKALDYHAFIMFLIHYIKLYKTKLHVRYEDK